MSLIICLFVQLFSSPVEHPSPFYVGARPAAMGNAFVALSDDPTALFWNPAGIVQTLGTALFGQMKADRNENKFDPKGITFVWRGFGLGWGNKIAIGFDDTPDYNYYSASLGLVQHASMGISLKFKRRHPCDYYQFFGEQMSVDIGVLAFVKPRLSVGLVWRDDHNDHGEASGGVAFRGEKMRLAIDLVRRAQTSFHLGAEIILRKYLRLRFGGWLNGSDQDSGISCGSGVRWGIISLDYAWIKTRNAQDHYFSVILGRERQMRK